MKKAVLVLAAFALGAGATLGQSVSNVQAGVKCPQEVHPLAGICYSMIVSTPGAPPLPGTIVKVVPSTGNSLGTIVLTVGDQGTELYEMAFTYGKYLVQNLTASGYTVAQVVWPSPNGWVGGGSGLVTLSGRYVAVVNWVQQNVQMPGTAFCATGNSAGAGLNAYAMSDWGMDQVFNFVEFTSGPPFADVSQGCIPALGENGTNACNTSYHLRTTYSLDEANILFDPAYGNNDCSDNIKRHGFAGADQFADDSLIDGNLNYAIFTIIRLGTQDNEEAATPQAGLFNTMLQSPHMLACSVAPHEIADTISGANDIMGDMLTYCKLPSK
jgi:hypothetical protein